MEQVFSKREDPALLSKMLERKHVKSDLLRFAELREPASYGKGHYPDLLLRKEYPELGKTLFARAITELEKTPANRNAMGLLVIARQRLAEHQTCWREVFERLKLSNERYKEADYPR